LRNRRAPGGRADALRGARVWALRRAGTRRGRCGRWLLGPWVIWARRHPAAASTIDRLLELTRDEDWYVRAAAAEAPVHPGPAAAVGWFVQLADAEGLDQIM
jgi:HEAT repeat protein